MVDASAVSIGKEGNVIPVVQPFKVETGDIDGQAAWKRILAAVDELLSEERPEDVSLH